MKHKMPVSLLKMASLTANDIDTTKILPLDEKYWPGVKANSPRIKPATNIQKPKL